MYFICTLCLGQLKTDTRKAQLSYTVGSVWFTRDPVPQAKALNWIPGSRKLTPTPDTQWVNKIASPQFQNQLVWFPCQVSVLNLQQPHLEAFKMPATDCSLRLLPSHKFNIYFSLLLQFPLICPRRVKLLVGGGTMFRAISLIEGIRFNGCSLVIFLTCIRTRFCISSTHFCWGMLFSGVALFTLHLF